MHDKPREARYGAGRSPDKAIRIAKLNFAHLKVTANSSAPDHQPIAKTFPPIFQTLAPPHWTIWVARGGFAQKPSKSSPLMPGLALAQASRPVRLTASLRP
jgi:hypothetical protein